MVAAGTRAAGDRADRARLHAGPVRSRALRGAAGACRTHAGRPRWRQRVGARCPVRGGAGLRDAEGGCARGGVRRAPSPPDGARDRGRQSMDPAGRLGRREPDRLRVCTSRDTRGKRLRGPHRQARPAARPGQAGTPAGRAMVDLQAVFPLHPDWRRGPWQPGDQRGTFLWRARDPRRPLHRPHPAAPGCPPVAHHREPALATEFD